MRRALPFVMLLPKVKQPLQGSSVSGIPIHKRMLAQVSVGRFRQAARRAVICGSVRSTVGRNHSRAPLTEGCPRRPPRLSARLAIVQRLQRLPNESELTLPVTVTLPPSLDEKKADEAVRVLHAYYAPISEGSGFTGGAWDAFDPSGTRATSANTFTADDLVACALLGAPIHGRATVELLQRQRSRFEELLEAIGPDRDFIEVASADGPDFQAVRSLYSALQGLAGIGETRATKLIARKRPRLVPIVDDVIKRTVFGNATWHWAPLHDALNTDDKALWNRLVHLREQANLNPYVSVLRVFDVLAWMEGSGNSERVLRGESIRVAEEDGQPTDAA